MEKEKGYEIRESNLTMFFKKFKSNLINLNR
jgi:hypothetical protein